jgi:hypothetical protein
VLQNLGSVKNAGVEATIHATLLDTRRFGWDLMLSASHTSNKLVSLGRDAAGLPNRTIGTGSLRDSVGLPINAYTYRAFKYSDANNDGYITANEVTVDANFSFTGYSQPRDIATVSNGFDLFNRRFASTASSITRAAAARQHQSRLPVRKHAALVRGRVDAQFSVGPTSARDGNEWSRSPRASSRPPSAIRRRFSIGGSVSCRRA